MSLKAWIRAIDYTRRSADVILPGIIEQLAEAHGDSIALVGQTENLTYSDLSQRVNGYARWAIEHRLRGETIALLMLNCPDYAAIWMGLTRVGCKVVLLNTNLGREALIHCLKVTEAGYLVGDDLTTALNRDVMILKLPDHGSSGPVQWPLTPPGEVALFIFTSGTTGLPKATKITHRRITEWSFWFAGMMDTKPNDRLYNCLPMYHSIGGITAIGSMLVSGGSVVIRRRFSASQFWNDVISYRCTIFQYIGELCRYLTLSPPSPLDHAHKLRLAVGNGLQASVWQAFQDRFRVPKILEYYAATEGMLSLYNCEGKPGSIGRIPPALEPYFVVKLIRVDQETGQPERNDDGFCMFSECGESGEAICRMKPDHNFDGYSDPTASARKILRNVVAEGDQWYRTGDLMRQDSAGFYYFVDRLGDTFRWKGENVSTTEVANVVRSCPGVVDAVVYGVQVTGNEGRVGMAAITTTEGFSFDTLSKHLGQLPTYARPMFIRLCQSLDITATFKLTKARLAIEGYGSVVDPVYVQRCGSFVPL